MAKIMKDMAQEQALLEVADLLQQLKILDNSTKNPESSLSCTYRVGSGRMQRLPISENYLVSMIATVQTDLQKKINGKNNEGHGTGAGSFRSGRLASAA